MIGGTRKPLDVFRRYPTLAGSVLIGCAFIGVSIYTIVCIPLSEAIVLWTGPTEVWRNTPRLAQPAWTNFFRREKLPETRIIPLQTADKATEQLGDALWRKTATLSFEYPYMHLPSEINLFLEVEYDTLHPQLTLAWLRPDGKELEIFRGTPGRSTRFAISKEIGLDEAYGGIPEGRALTGEYALRIEAFAFEEKFSMSGRLVIYGRVHGIAGTDNLRRDLLIGLLWGMPIGLAFGLLATIGTTLLGFTLAALGSWFGGWGDAAIQRLTEVNMMLPLLPILIMVGKFYSSSIWVMLGVIIALSTFTGTIKTYRAMFLQAKNASYIEAARAYGASHGRIVFRYLMPRIIPVLVPTFVLGIPRFVFLEASLGLLGLSDPILPTWGKILTDAYQGGALYRGHYYWLLEPAVLLMAAGLSFSMLGFALDRLFNPRLRGV